MCESMLECEELVYTTWWWIPVLEASRSSRLSVVGYTSCPAHTLKDVQKHADTLDPGPFLDLWLLQTALYPTTYCYVVTGWIWMLFCLPIVEAVRMSVLYFRAFMQAVTMTTGLLPTFLGSCRFPKIIPSLNNNENEHWTDQHFLTKCPSLMDIG